MLKVSKSVLKARMLEYFRRVQKTGEELIVTDHRVPVLKVVPLNSKKTPANLFADVRGKVRYMGNLLEPETAEWAALS
jgi:antitoxin (DNA-binding transcriptional repressor) of toxin-antitoxin stability system